MPFESTSTQDQIQELKRRIASLTDQAETQVRLKLKEARAVVTDLEKQLSEVTGRPSASELKAVPRARWPSITDGQLELQVLYVLTTAGNHGMNAKTLAGKLNQSPLRIRQFIRNNPKALKRVGSGPATKFFVP